MNTSSAADATPSAGFWRVPKVLSYLDISRSTLYRAIDGGDFPRPVRLTKKAIAWDAAEIQRWAAARLAARD
ncbi:MAG: AlpA family phage regulatory protein [Lysobacterales bacterium]